MKLFWRRGLLSAREVQDEFGEASGWAGSTTRTVLARMTTKGLLRRRSAHGLAVYIPARDKVEVIGRTVKKFADALEIDDPLSIAALAGGGVLSVEEMTELQALLAEDAPALP